MIGFAGTNHKVKLRAIVWFKRLSSLIIVCEWMLMKQTTSYSQVKHVYHMGLLSQDHSSASPYFRCCCRCLNSPYWKGSFFSSISLLGLSNFILFVKKFIKLFRIVQMGGCISIQLINFRCIRFKSLFDHAIIIISISFPKMLQWWCHFSDACRELGIFVSPSFAYRKFNQLIT